MNSLAEMMFCKANNGSAWSTKISQKWCFGTKFFSEKFKKIIVGAYGKKNLILSIYIFDLNLQASHCFILW